MKIAFLSHHNELTHPFDLQFLYKICDQIKFFNIGIREYLTELEDIITNNEFDIFILKDFHKLDEKLVYDIKNKIDEILAKRKSNILIVDILEPSAQNEKEEIFKRKNVTLFTDYSFNQFENSIEIPILSLLNFDIHHIQDFDGRLDLKKFTMFTNHEFENRKYDIMFRVGKPKPIRLLVSLLLLNNKFNNLYTNISFSQEHSIVSPNNIIDELKYSGLELIVKQFGLNDEEKQLKVETYLGSTYRNKFNFKYKSNRNYTVDFNSYAEIYTESITSNLDIIKNHPNLIAFTEKTFSNFFDFKIPLPIDIKNNIDYLKNLGFQFPIEPCYLESGDTIDSVYQKLNNWIINIKQYNFKELWREWVFGNPINSPLHKNHKLICDFMENISQDTNLPDSKLKYLGTYKLIEKFFPNVLNEFKNWDYQSYLFLKTKHLL